MNEPGRKAMKKSQSFITAVGIAVALALSPHAEAGFGKKGGGGGSTQLGAEWWQWALAIPLSVNPMFDTTGENCMVGQHGSTWFLAGSAVGPVTRDCDVPQGATLFFPVIDEINFDTPNQCGQGGPLNSTAYRELSAEFINGAANLSVVLDGKAVNKLNRMQSPVFEIALPEVNFFAGACAPDLTDGVYSPAVDDGYYVQLSNLAVGAHTLVIHAEQPALGFSLDVTYNLTVVPVVKK
jgi:hypothetical protein